MENKRRIFPKHPFSTHGGAPVPHRKNTAEIPSVVMEPPKQVVLPMQQHVGAPCTPVVKKGDVVSVGQLIGDSDKFISAPIHASISGTVSQLSTIMLPNGQVVDAVVIDSDGEMRLSPDIKPPVVENKEQLFAAIRASGLVGLGGAGFPAAVKLNVPEGKKIDTILINGAECEPYITADYRGAMEDTDLVMAGVYTLLELLEVNRVIIAIESNKPEAIRVLTEIAENKRDQKDQVKVLELKSRYPQGAEKVLVQACTGRKIPKGKLPADVGCLVVNITSVAFLANYLKTGMPLVTKRLTVDGSAVAEPKNVIVPIGTSIHDLIAFCGGYRETPAKILMGGPMMGMAVVDDSLPVLKQNNAILAFTEHDAALPAPTACIRCGRCVKACPMNLMPTLLESLVRRKDAAELDRMGVMTCMECGSCAYVCPANRLLVQSMRLGKGIVKNAAAQQR